MTSRICFTLDVLTDGSEFTGAGTIFLSVWKRPKQHAASALPIDDVGWLKELIYINVPLARYAISGLGDATARLAADQRLKLAQTRAVFLSSPGSFDGLSSLLLALHSAGAPSLHVVTAGEGNAIEELAGITLGANRHVNIMTCKVPYSESTMPSKGEERPPPSWWKVYEDDYLTVHARRHRDSQSYPCDSVVYLYSIYQGGKCCCTLALLPPCSRDLVEMVQKLKKQQLPLSRDESTSISIDQVLALKSTASPNDITKGAFGKTQFFLTLPDQVRKGPERYDPGLLIRSQQVGGYFHDKMPWAFPATSQYQYPPKKKAERGSSNNSEDTSNIEILRSCTSVCFNVDGSKTPFVVLNRQPEIWGRPLSDEWTSTLKSLQSFIPPPPSTADENEIDLDDDDDDDDDEESEEMKVAVAVPSGPELVVLGTGCASPSAFRGSSGYALVFPTTSGENEKVTTRNDMFILDCGEGVTTMLSRYYDGHSSSNKDDNRNSDDSWVDEIQGIWISHAHLDHYGGLPTLLRVIHERRHKGQQQPLPERSTKKAKLERNNVPWVMAPPKVLRYLDILLECRHGYLLGTKQQVFSPRVHHDPTIPQGPWSWFQNIKVYHNCCPSYGLLLGWKNQPCTAATGTNSRMNWLCFSGDTRPCHSLVNACHYALRSTGSHGNFLLLHEATFEDEEQEQAEKKKHSTVSEAMMVATDIPATRVLLTHFSQRYISLNTDTTTAGSTGNNNAKTISRTSIPVGFAMDGLWIPLADT